MMPGRQEPQVHLLESAAARLARGDWRSAWILLFHEGLVTDRQDLSDVAVCLRSVARSLRDQSVYADVQSAADRIDEARGILGRYPRAQLAVEPSRLWRIDRLLWSTSRLVRRERADLDALRIRLADSAKGREELAHAGVEYLTHVEFDPWSVTIHPWDRELTGLDDDAYARWRTGNPKDMCLRATRLRQFAAVRNGPLSEKTWQRTGGYPGVREQALLTLAAEPLTRGRADLPIRLGRRRAWEYARAWARDTST